MLRRSACSMFVAGTLALLAGCADKAQPDYAKCVQADTTGDLAGAMKACSDAIGADPNSTSGKAAAAKLGELKPKYDKWKADEDAKVAAKAKADAEWKAKSDAMDAVLARNRLDALKAKVKTSSLPHRLDYESEKCVSDGHPPHALDFEGGTYAENREVAVSRGCVKNHPGDDNNWFCCP